jgi:hypothetical protein
MCATPRLHVAYSVQIHQGKWGFMAQKACSSPWEAERMDHPAQLTPMLHKKMKNISQIVKSVRFKVDFILVSGSHQWCDPRSVRFFSIFLCNNGVKLLAVADCPCFLTDAAREKIISRNMNK